MKNDLVVFQNNFLGLMSQSKTKHTALELKIIYSFISVLEIKQDDFWNYTVRVNNLGDYKDVKKAVIRIASNPILIESISKRGKSQIETQHIFNPLKYEDGGFLSGQIHSYFKPYLLQLKKDLGITKFGLQNILKLSKPTEMQLYTFFKKEQFKRSIELSIEDINNMFKTKYIWKDIKNRILSNIDNINKQTDIKVSYVTKKIGRKIVSVKFHIIDDSFENFVKNLRKKYNNSNVVLTVDKQERAYYINANGHIECQNIVLPKEESIKVWKWVYENKYKNK